MKRFSHVKPFWLVLAAVALWLIATTPDDSAVREQPLRFGKSGEKIVTKVYPIGHVLSKGGYKNRLSDRRFVAFIINTVEPESWEANRGEGKLQFQERTATLIVTNRRKVHRRLEETLRSLEQFLFTDDEFAMIAMNGKR